MIRPLTNRELVSVAVLASVALLMTAAVTWLMIERSASKSSAGQIAIHSPSGTRIFNQGPITVARLRSEFIEEGRLHTQITIVPDYLQPSEFGVPRVTFEFDRNSDLSAFAEFPNSLGSNLTNPFLVPRGAAVEVVVDGSLPKDALGKYDWDGFVRYNLRSRKRPDVPFYSGSDAPRFDANILWSCEVSSGAGEYEDVFILKASPETITGLINGLERACQLMEAGKVRWDQFRWRATTLRKRPILELLQRKHGFSDSTLFFDGTNGDTDRSLGLDPETGLIYNYYYNI